MKGGNLPIYIRTIIDEPIITIDNDNLDDTVLYQNISKVMKLLPLNLDILNQLRINKNFMNYYFKKYALFIYQEIFKLRSLESPAEYLLKKVPLEMI